MTPSEFVQEYKDTVLNENQVAQSHFRDVCRLVGVEMPVATGKTGNGEIFTFEHPVKTESGRGRADVYYEGRFAVEYKTPGKYKDFYAAYQQLLRYRESLNNPPLLVVTDIKHWEIHTNFPGTRKRIYRFSHNEIGDDPEKLGWLRSMFEDPHRLNPGLNTEQVTKEAAKSFEVIADNMRDWDEKPTPIAYFLTKLVFCLFAEDVGLLPRVRDTPVGIFRDIIRQSKGKPRVFHRHMQNLFKEMNGGGEYFGEDIQYFNGTLFSVVTYEELSLESLDALADAAKLNWAAIEPSIFGTLFERSLDPSKRAQLGAHYTSREDILLIVEPVLMQPLRYEWDTVKLEAAPVRERLDNAQTGRGRVNARNKLLELRGRILSRIRETTVLDPACGSGNFLYVSLQELMELERRVIQHPLWSGLQLPTPAVHPRQLFGIEKAPIAHALASIVVWIGFIQWRIKNNYGRTFGEPILEKLQGNIVCKDAILATNEYGLITQPEWPTVDVIVGNPPFLGNRKMRPELGDEYVSQIEDVFYPAFGDLTPDLVCYWHQKSLNHLLSRKVKRVGLLATNSIRGGTNRRVLEHIVDRASIFNAWSDREWILDGAAVRVSMICFDNRTESSLRLDGLPVVTIHPDLTADVDITGAQRLIENRKLSFQAIIKRGAFDMDGSQARKMIAANPKNRAVLKPIANGVDVTRRPRGKWIVDFGVDSPIEYARQFEEPFNYVATHVKPVRQNANQLQARELWWLHWNPRPAMRTAFQPIDRYIATPAVAKHRLFVWLPMDVHPDHALIVFPRDDGLLLRCPPLHTARSLVAAHGHIARRPTPLHTHHHIRDLPLSLVAGGEDESHPRPRRHQRRRQAAARRAPCLAESA